MYFLFEHYVLRALALYKASTFYHALKIALWCAVGLAFGRSLDRHLFGIHFHLVHLDTGGSHTRSFHAGPPLDSVIPGQRINESPHEAEVAARDDLSRPQPDYDVLHGRAGHLMQLCPLCHLVI